jgi:hypothetical protein
VLDKVLSSVMWFTEMTCLSVDFVRWDVVILIYEGFLSEMCF